MVHCFIFTVKDCHPVSILPLMLEDHLLLATRDFSFNVFILLPTSGDAVSSIYNMKTRHVVVERDTEETCEIEIFTS